MKKYNISKPHKYVSNGVEKTYWDKVGEMVEFPKQDGSVSRIIKIPAIGLEANVFEEKPREASVYQPTSSTLTSTPVIEYPTEENINPADIPPDDIPF